MEMNNITTCPACGQPNFVSKYAYNSIRSCLNPDQNTHCYRMACVHCRAPLVIELQCIVTVKSAAVAVKHFETDDWGYTTLKHSNRHKHRWIVYSTSMSPPRILVQCECGALGEIDDSTREEWNAAFNAPSKSYLWPGGDDRIKNIRLAEK
jgi:hypothetical protein